MSVLAGVMLRSSTAAAWETRTHQQITEAAWALIKARAEQASFFGATDGEYPSPAEAQRAVAFFQNLEAHHCRPGAHCLAQFEPPKKLMAYDATAGETLLPDGDPLSSNPGGGVYSPYLDLLTTGGIAIAIVPGEDSKIDYTGTILGYYAGYGDYLEDTYGEVGNQLALDATRTSISIFEVLAAIAACAGCVVSGAACAGCAAIAGGIWAAEEWAFDYLDELSETPSSKLLGHTLSAYWHFQNTYPYNPNARSDFDDVDGFDHRKQKDTDWLKDFLIGWGADTFDIHVRDDMSYNPIAQYQIFSGDDGQSFSSTVRAAPDWWTSHNIANTTFMPADNMARAHWENWLKMKRTRAPGGAAEGKPYDLTYLGVALHAMQDATAYHHGVGTLVVGHEDYEQHVARHFDSLEFRRKAKTFDVMDFSASRLIMTWHGTAGEKAAADIKDKLASLTEHIAWAKGVAPHAGNRNDLPIRMLSQYLLHRVQSDHKDLEEGKNYDSPLDASREERSEHGKVAIPWAIAATIVMLIEASNPDIDSDGVGTMPMSMFNQHELDTDGDGVPDTRDFCQNSNDDAIGFVDAQGCPENTNIGNSEYRAMFRTCVEAGTPPVEEVFDGGTSQDDFMSLFFLAKAECESTELGFGNGTISERYQVAERRWLLYKNFLQTQDRLAFVQEHACLRADYPQVFPNADQTRDAALCQCTADTDGDGVSDCADECDFTPQGASVDSKGCAL